MRMTTIFIDKHFAELHSEEAPKEEAPKAEFVVEFGKFHVHTIVGENRINRARCSAG